MKIWTQNSGEYMGLKIWRRKYWKLLGKKVFKISRLQYYRGDWMHFSFKTDQTNRLCLISILGVETKHLLFLVCLEKITKKNISAVVCLHSRRKKDQKSTIQCCMTSEEISKMRSEEVGTYIQHCNIQKIAKWFCEVTKITKINNEKWLQDWMRNGYWFVVVGFCQLPLSDIVQFR
jgi:hypothetical protein